MVSAGSSLPLKISGRSLSYSPGFISVAVIKYSNNRQLKGELMLACSPRLQFIAVKARQELTVAGHITFTVKSREKRMRACFLACTQLTCSAHTHFRTPCLRPGASHSKLDSPTSINLRQSPTETLIGQPNTDSSSPKLSSQWFQVVLSRQLKLTITVGKMFAGKVCRAWFWSSAFKEKSEVCLCTTGMWPR